MKGAPRAFHRSLAGNITPGTVFDETICLTDILATCASAVGHDLADDEGEDSFDLLPTLLGEAEGPIRETTIHHSGAGGFAIRKGNWKLILECEGDGYHEGPVPGSPGQFFHLGE